MRDVGKHDTRTWARRIVVVSLVSAAPLASGQAQEAVDPRIEALERQMQEMQRAFAAQLQELQREIEALRRAQPPEVVEAPPPAPIPGLPPEAQPSVVRDQSPQETITTTEQATEPVISSGEEKIKVSISGQINRAINVANDGDKTKAYFVDNDVSNSRLRLLGLANYDEDIRFGGLLEVALSPNNSSDVSQDNEDAGDLINVRRAETGVDSRRFGRIWLGKGSAATDNVAEYDLSGVDVIMYAGVADIAGGLQFRDKDGELSGLTVADAFFDFDGDRQNRIRYDTPVLGPGLQFSVSAGADQRYDASLNWGGDFDQWSGVDLGPFTTLAAIGVSDPSENGVDYRLMGSGAVLHNPTGLNLTISGGMDEADSGDPYNLYLKGGWYGTLNTLGNTGFGIDFTRGHDVAAPGDTGYSVGGAIVQTVTGYGTELYSQVRWYSLDREDAPSVDDIVVGTLGVPIRAADPPRHNTEIPQGPGLFTGADGEFIILRR